MEALSCLTTIKIDEVSILFIEHGNSVQYRQGYSYLLSLQNKINIIRCCVIQKYGTLKSQRLKAYNIIQFKRKVKINRIFLKSQEFRQDSWKDKL